jgi:ATP-dependent Lhr-like helicase
VLFPEAQAPGEHAGVLIAQRRAARLEAGGRRFLVPAERVQHARALFPGLPLSPTLEPLPGDGPVAREVAALAVVRGRVEIDGPTTARELAEKLGLGAGEVNGALAALEAQGQVLRGMFRPEDRRPEGTEIEWCDRRLLQRIHRLTVGRLRREVEPLSAQDYMRFLFRWHHFDEPLRGTGGLLKAVSLLQGYEAPAAAWEVFLLPARMKQYFPELLEKACFNGEVAWGRLTLRARTAAAMPGPRRGVPAEPVEPSGPPSRGASPNRNANITFVRREELDWMLAAARPGVVLSDGGLALPEDLSHAARDVAQVLERRGASFFADLVGGSRRLQSEVEDALWELLAHGLVTADALENLRVLQSPKRRKRQKLLRRGGPGRWSLMVPSEQRPGEEIHDRTARLFLQRYGIVWRDLVLREPLSPSWRELLFIYRRMEARGEIRGGRFLSSFAGEQFALPEAVDMARAVRRAPLTGHTVHLSAVDPLNLTGIATPGPRVPAMMGNVITYVDGAPAPVQAPAAARSQAVS